MTLADLLKEQPSTSQYDILIRADRLCRHHGGRYFSGVLRPELVTQLTTGVELRPELKARIAVYTCVHEFNEQPGEPPVDICSRCGAVRA